MNRDNKRTQIRHAKAVPLMVALAALACVATPALAQVAKVNTVMSNIQALLVGISITVVTISLLWVGFKMAFQHAKWSEVSNIVIGASIVGGAPGIAAWLIN
jgi:type IV secretion system protein VirB2